MTFSGENLSSPTFDQVASSLRTARTTPSWRLTEDHRAEDWRSILRCALTERSRPDPRDSQSPCRFRRLRLVNRWNLNYFSSSGLEAGVVDEYRPLHVRLASHPSVPRHAGRWKVGSRRQRQGGPFNPGVAGANPAGVPSLNRCTASDCEFFFHPKITDFPSRHHELSPGEAVSVMASV